VRDVERRVQSAPSSKQAAKAATTTPKTGTTGEARAIEDRLRRHLQTDVSVHLAKGKKTKGTRKGKPTARESKRNQTRKCFTYKLKPPRPKRKPSKRKPAP
jgi:hypothetical protein